MAAQVLSFFQRSPRHAPQPADWTQQELAEFYRVESALIRAGIRVGTDRGLSDENEPWFIFYRADDGEVVIHFARIDGEYLIAGPAYEEIARGFDFTALVRNMVARHPLIRRPENNSNLSIHPAALLIAVVGTAFFKTGEARAAETGATNAQSGHARPVLLSSSSTASLSGGVAPVAVQQSSAYDTVQLPVNQAVLVLAAALLASDYGVDTASLQPTAQSAIAAAAASLDFGPIGGSASGLDAVAILPAPTHTVTTETSPAQTVSSVLSLVALLSSLPDHGDTPTAGLSSFTDGDAHRDLAANDLPAANDAANWTLDVRLGLGLDGLPSVQAVQLIRGALGDAGAQKILVIEVAKLPDVLADLIAKGEHYSVSPATPPQVLNPDTTPSTPDTTPTGGDTGATPPATPHDKPTTPDPTTGHVPTALVEDFIKFFIAHTNGVEVVQHGQDIIMFDASILRDGSAATHLMSMTFDFADGGSISLVGNHSAFLHDGILV
ncbi:hypothetical protein [Caulobacter sp. RL271]|jgi:hypothetical protein|uniref:Uncharacterized protein n=1 Tax=Caulobacter segnis TaxID=88688 RepID=A0ABY4ZX69_9CAUL|nr:hypothetical protein [Caulobacter segnis]USQ97427.1 hypothetical protein MZV50_07760 [Caulobacter segnis]